MQKSSDLPSHLENCPEMSIEEFDQLAGKGELSKKGVVVSAARMKIVRAMMTEAE